MLVATGGVIHGHDLPPSLQTAEVSGTLPRMSLASATAALEMDLIQDALKSSRGNVAAAAPPRNAGLDRHAARRGTRAR